MAKLPIYDFLSSRLKEYDAAFEVRKGTGFAQLFINPMQFMLQPIVDEAVELTIGQSFLRILQQPSPDAFPEERVDSLASNYFVTRNLGGYSSGSVRVYYGAPVNREWPANGTLFLGQNGKNYTNPSPFSITSAEMSLQIDNGLYYHDIIIKSQDLGLDTELPAEGISGLSNDPESLTVTNSTAIKGGTDRETNTQLITRTQKSIAVRDLVTGKGFNATMFESFVGFLSELTPVGFGEKEMMRDVQYNIHIGGKIDGYFKTANVLQSFKNFVGILPDYTRQAYGSTNLQMFYTTYAQAPDGNFDVSNGKRPIVKQVKSSSSAKFTSTVDLSNPIILPADARVRLIIDGADKTVNVAGSNPASTTKSDIINHINASFGYILATSVGPFFQLTSRIKGAGSSIVIEDATLGASVLLSVFGIAPPGVIVYGDGPITFSEISHYTITTDNGSIKRVLGPAVVALQATGSVTTNSNIFTDPTSAIFASVHANDIVTFNPYEPHHEDPSDNPATYLNDYRVVAVTDDNTLVLDATVPFTATDVSYFIKRTGIKHRETIYIQYWFSPLSIDIGPQVWNFDIANNSYYRGIRPNRAEYTVTDVSFLKINKVEVIDPVTFEPTGEILATGGGYGDGGYGEGPYGIGSGSDYYMIVNSPHERFSVFEDSYIVLHPSFIGMSVRVDYDCVPECLTMHNFVRSEDERVLDGDILMKHFLPAYVDATIQYKIDSTDSSIPTNEDLTTALKEFINKLTAGSSLEISDVYQFITRKTDPYDRYSSYIKPFTMTAVIHNIDGTTTVITSDDKLEIPTLTPFPKYTERPLSPRIAHWIAGNIVLERL